MIIFLYGEDTYRSRQKLNELKNKFFRDIDPGGSSFVMIDGETVNMEKVNEAVSTPSLFTRKRMIVIERIFSNKARTVREQMLEFLKAKDKIKAKAVEENIIIFWEDISDEGQKTDKLFKFLLKQKYVQSFNPLSNTEATNWAKREIIARGGKITGASAMHLTSLIGNDLWQLSNEINKLINYKEGAGQKLLKTKSETEININDIETQVKGKVDENIFALTDAISNKNKALAMKLFDSELEAGVADTYLMHMIIRQFRILMQVRQGLDSGLTQRKIATKLKLHPFVMQKSLSQVQKFSLPNLKNIFLDLIKLDRDIKSGEIEAKTGLSLLIAKV